MTMIENVAAALASLPIRDMAAPGGELDQLRLREAARTAIQAMRHPNDFLTFTGNRYFGCHPSDPMAETAWQAMIDAALAEKPTL